MRFCCGQFVNVTRSVGKLCVGMPVSTKIVTTTVTMNYTDYLRLNDLKIVKTARESVPEGLKKSTNLLKVKDGVLYAWDFSNNCVLTLNLKAARSREGDNVSHQNLLPLLPVLFQPELLDVNDTGSLLVVAGPSGILVLELPARHPPYGAFDSNKDVVYCRTHSLDERLLFCSDVVKVRQVRFHPAAPKNDHLLALTSDNVLRLYVLANGEALSKAIYQVGDIPMGTFPGTKTSYLHAFGEVAVDFDFGQPEIEPEVETLFVKPPGAFNFQWPVYVLRGDGSIFSLNVDPEQRTKPKVKLLPTNIVAETPQEEACSLISINCNPEILCVANSSGTIYHLVVLPDENSKELLCFESVELELGLSTNSEDNSYTCPIFLHKDESRPGRYFATHSAGIHSVLIACLKDLQAFVRGNSENVVQEDIFNCESKAEYLVCTKTSSSETTNPVIGFSLYYEPTSLIAILADRNLVSLGILTSDLLPLIEDLAIEEGTSEAKTSPLKKMLREPFDSIVQKILMKSTNQPILKLGGGGGNRSQKECYELLQRTSNVLRNQFNDHTNAQEELEKRIKALQMLKQFNWQQLERMNEERQALQARAENLAERYEDIKDKQDVIMKRCEKLLVVVSQKRSEPSDAEREFLQELERFMAKTDTYKKSIEKLNMKVKYQKIKIANWKAQELSRVSTINEKHTQTIQNNLKECSEKIGEMVKEVKEYKGRLNLK